MQLIRRKSVVAAIVATFLVPVGARPQSTTPGSDTSSVARVDALAQVEANRSSVIREAIDRWRSQFRPFDATRNTGGEEERLAAALQTASAEKLLAASHAETYQEALAALFGDGPSVVALRPGDDPNLFGDPAADIVFTPITPCRIIDTRVATNPALLGRIGPDAGKQFSVSLTNYASQGGNAGTCGVPIAPTAVAINVTSTDQTGAGNLRVVQTGGGIPNVSLLNYTPGVNLANAAVVRSAGTLGGDNIFIYSGNSSSQAIVDILGYFAGVSRVFMQTTFVFANVPASGTAANAMATRTFTPAKSGTVYAESRGYCNLDQLTSTVEIDISAGTTEADAYSASVSDWGVVRVPGQASPLGLFQVNWTSRRAIAVTAGVAVTLNLYGRHNLGTAADDCSGTFIVEGPFQ
jgi:hypothetical protein